MKKNFQDLKGSKKFLRFKTLFFAPISATFRFRKFFITPLLISKNFPNYFSLIFQIWGPPLHCTSDRPCQRIIFPIEKSLHEFFFSNFSGARIFFSVSPARFLFF